MLIGAVGGLIVVLSIVGLDKMQSTIRWPPYMAPAASGVCWILITNDDATLAGQYRTRCDPGLYIRRSLGRLVHHQVGFRHSPVDEEQMKGADSAEIGIAAYPEFSK